jgi:hypothetical protein
MLWRRGLPCQEAALTPWLFLESGDSETSSSGIFEMATYRKPDFSGCGVFRLLYPLGMREEELRRYFMDEASISQLAKDISGSVVNIDDLQSEISDCRHAGFVFATKRSCNQAL